MKPRIFDTVKQLFPFRLRGFEWIQFARFAVGVYGAAPFAGRESAP
jgi:hypothetical protein